MRAQSAFSRLRTLAALAMLGLPVLAAAGTGCQTSLPQDKLNECYEAAAGDAQKELDGLMVNLKHSLTSKGWAETRESAIYWEKTRLLDCKVEAAQIDGPVRYAVRWGCTEKRTRERIHQLRYLLCPRYNLTGQCDAEALYP